MNLNKAQFLETADRIGVALCRDAFWDGGRCTWLGWIYASSNHAPCSMYSALAADLYGGTSGIALFLAELHQFTQDRQQLRAIEGAVNQVLTVCDAMQGPMRYGFYTGQAGIAYALTRIGHLIERDDLIERGLHMVEALMDLKPEPKYIDVINGSAGLIPVLLCLGQTYQRADFITLATRHGAHLVRLLSLDERGGSWDTTPVQGLAHLTGHSHGAAGIATALLELAAVTGERSFYEAALQGLRYERNLFNHEFGNWPDLRGNPQSAKNQAPSTPVFSMAWCHGAPGIGLSRLRNAEILRDHAEILKDLEWAINTTANSFSLPWTPSTSNYSLCHGASGNAELMIMAGQSLHRPELTRIAEKVGGDAYEWCIKRGLPWPCGNNGVGETPSLMLGTAGIGHFYLRLFDAVRVPSVLIIKPEMTPDFSLSRM